MKPVITILGSTCSWKSEIAFHLAQQLNGEIISCDSMQVYRGLAIGTAQPSQKMRSIVPHHLVDCFDISERYDASRFVDLVLPIIQDIRNRKKHPIIVGGTGLYARALIYGMTLLPSDHELSLAMRPLLETEEGKKSLWNEILQKAGSEDSIPKDVRLNPRRWLRACEVLRLTGELPWKLTTKNQNPDSDYIQFCIIPEFQMLKQRIRCRTDVMLKQGWIEEALEAENRGLMETPTARQALGYREILDYIHKGQSALPGNLPLNEVLANRTINYARRQLTWFRHQHPGAELLHLESENNAPNNAIAAILSKLN